LECGGSTLCVFNGHGGTYKLMPYVGLWLPEYEPDHPEG